MSHDRYRRPSSSSHDAGIVYAPSRGGRPGGARRSDRVYGGVRPSPQGDAASVQRKPRPGADPQKAPIQMLGYNLARAGWQAAEAQSSWLDFAPERTRDPGDRGVYDAAAMPSAATRPVQRKAVVNEMDAPKADSIREDRATIEARPAPAAPAPTAARGADNLASGGLSRSDLAGYVPGDGGDAVAPMDAPKEDSIHEDRATIEPGDEADAAGPLSAAQAAHAVTRNRHTAAVYHVRPADVDTSASAETPAFAQAVARFQQTHGLMVDGIVGPKTVKALHATGRHQDARPASGAPGASGGEPAAGADGQAHASLLQMKQAAEPAPDADVPAVAAAGVAGTGQPLPHLEPIQASFGRHDVSGVVAHVGGAAGEAAQQIGAVAYATGNQVAFDRAPDLHTTAHEAAHVVQQRGGGTADLQGKGGVGQVGDAHEQHADQVADTVARGESAEALLDAYAAPASSPHGHRALQRKVHSPTRHERGAARLALQQAAALARAHAAEPTAAVCFQVADALRYAAASIAPIEGPSEPATLRRFLQPANLAYARAAALHDAASATLGDDDAAVAALHDAMLDLAGRLEPTGWRRPADARAARRRGRRARSRGAKETFGARDRASLVRQSLAAAGDALGIIPSDGHPLAKTALDAIAARAHQHIEFAFDQMLDSGPGPQRPFAGPSPRPPTPCRGSSTRHWFCATGPRTSSTPSTSPTASATWSAYRSCRPPS